MHFFLMIANRGHTAPLFSYLIQHHTMLPSER